MRKIAIAIKVEYLKIKSSKIFWITLFLFILIPIMMGLMIYIVRHPEISAKLGIIGAKASLFGNADGPAYMGLVIQAIASVGLIGYGFVTSWMFGSEHTQHTMKDILALPVSRNHIVLAKFFIVICWSILLSFVMIISALIISNVMNLSGFTATNLKESISTFTITALMTILLCSPVAFLAGYGRGLVAPLGFIFVTMIMAQFVALSGLGAYFPWSIPGLNTAPEGTEGMKLLPVSYVILTLTFIGGYWATQFWWNHADHH
ncbi:MAG: ABC transporter permease [Bacteroidales bacterium]|nr:ABC transporter permease [Bacteroidales bacterium]